MNEFVTGISIGIALKGLSSITTATQHFKRLSEHKKRAVTFSWSPCIRGAGASEIECDSIIAGEDEILDSLEFIITCESDSFMTKSSSFTVSTSKNQGYTVVAKSGIYTSQNAYIYM